MENALRLHAIDELSKLGSVLEDKNLRDGSIVEVDLGRGGSEVNDAILVHLRRLPELQHLYLDKTCVTDRIMEVLRFCRSLRVLHIEDTQITDAGLEQLKHGQSLESLTIGFDSPDCESPITNLGFQHVGFATNLTQLALSRTSVTAAGMANIMRLDQLKNLTLSPRQLGAQCVPVLKGLPNLKTVWLTRGYPVAYPLIDLEPVADSLRKALPHIEVSY